MKNKNNGNQVIHACLLISAIQECSKAFSQECEVNNYTEEELLECTFKLADLGTVHSYDQMIAERRFPCIQTRYYRAPEVILKIPYNHKVDFWSMAAMYYELVEGKTMFDPHHEGDISTDQVHLYQMIEWIGNPSREKINISPLKKFFDKEYKLKYAIDYVKEDINPEKWHPEVLSFFTLNLSWRN
jgi:serine/threonine protein kinase